MKTKSWLRRRRWTFFLAAFFVILYALQLSVSHLYSENVARWWFYLERPPDILSPGIVFAPISHDIATLKHLGANLVFLIVAGGIAEPYIGKERMLELVIGLGYLSIFATNVTAIVHQLWVVAGASGGILALWAYAGLQMRDRVKEFKSAEETPIHRSVETVGATTLYLGIPAIFFHQVVLVNPPHSGHIAGLLLGCLYYLVVGYR